MMTSRFDDVQSLNLLVSVDTYSDQMSRTTDQHVVAEMKGERCLMLELCALGLAHHPLSPHLSLKCNLLP